MMFKLPKQPPNVTSNICLPGKKRFLPGFITFLCMLNCSKSALKWPLKALQLWEGQNQGGGPAPKYESKNRIELTVIYIIWENLKNLIFSRPNDHSWRLQRAALIISLTSSSGSAKKFAFFHWLTKNGCADYTPRNSARNHTIKFESAMGFKKLLSCFKKSSRGNLEPGEKTEKYHTC